tara:strand:- start:189 stop:290 length:102 start_codon:yes stop_codon:yes gene_type:complete
MSFEFLCDNRVDEKNKIKIARNAKKYARKTYTV